ncbi:MAG: 4a-hydroxytetrahydrobiopterin dehydratase [Planctomycetes bacterium]|nr:4a-hydroxytetrahydrobiopterin dehydratase [Planctomycetota bacterium]
MVTDLAKKKCTPCRGGVPPLDAATITPLAAHVPHWTVVRNHHLHRAFTTRNFADALDLVNRIGRVAEQEHHHPEVTLSWGRVGVDIWTHKIDGLTESDFILAAKIDEAALTAS